MKIIIERGSELYLDLRGYALAKTILRGYNIFRVYLNATAIVSLIKLLLSITKIKRPNLEIKSVFEYPISVIEAIAVPNN
jgi:hypothetical protein